MRNGRRNPSRVSPPTAAIISPLEPRLLFHDGPDAADGGLVATYFDNPDFTASVLTRTDRVVDFYWAADTPAPQVAAGTFSARWTGNLVPHTTETYTFTLRAHGGVKLVVDGQVLIDAPAGPAGTVTEQSGSVALTKDAPVSVQIEYAEQAGPAGIRFYWETPTIAREAVPADHLDPGLGTPPPAPPTPPANVAVSPISATQARLTWTDTASNETGFVVSRSANLGTFTTVGNVPADGAEFVDSNLTPGVRYFYRIQAVSPIGSSDWGDYATTIADGVGEPLQPPAAPGDLVAVAGESAVTLTWTDRSSDETQFVVSRRAGSASAFEDIATLGTGTTTYADADVSPGVTYAYRVRAASAIGQSAASNAAEATIPVVGEPQDDFTQVNWATGKAGPVARNESLTAAIDGKLYVFAGFDSQTQPMSRVDVYDTATDAWTRLRDMPVRLTHAGVATVARSVYFAGGYVGVGASGGKQTFGVTDVWRYDVDTDTYAAMPPLPERRGSGGLVALGSELHFFGGNNSDREDVGDHYVLDLNGGTSWTTAAPLPNGRSHMGYAAVGGKIYAIAGQRGNDAELVTQGDVHVWDPAEPGKWTKLTSIPQAVSHVSSSSFVVGGRILVLGGETAHQAAVRTNWAYDPATDTWAELTRLPESRRSGVAGIIDGVLYYATGSKTNVTYVGTPTVDGN